MIEDKEFLSQFKNYSDTYNILGVRIPQVNIGGSYAKKFDLDLSKDEHEILRQLCLHGYKKLNIDALPNKDVYRERVKFELETLKKLGFTRYILMVWDLIQWCDENKIARGWGRGSVAGSLVSYLIGLTAVDPIKYDLIFERFINESRAQSKIVDGEQYSDGSTVPDIDFDVCYLNRSRVVYEYLGSKYPKKTGHISTLNTLSTKLVLKEVCKKYGGYDETQANRLSNMIESDAGKLDSLKDTLEKNDQFKEWVEENPKIYNICLKLSDLPKNFGLHAAGIIVSYDEIFNSLPLENRDGIITSSYTKDDVAEQEIKLDALGLKTCTIIYETAKEAGYDLNSFDPNDPEIYKLFEKFDYSYGVFQLDGDTACKVTKQVQPKNISDISAISAIARPGALAFLEDFLESRKTGEIKSIYPPIDEILANTSGVILYQEQTMKIAHEVYKFSLVEADILRKIIGKKQLEKVKEWEEKIKKAGIEQGIPESATQIFWETVQASAKYQFNASHSYSYGYISCLCAYLKIKYPAIFFKNCLMLARSFQDSEARIMKICKELPYFGIELRPPDLVKSEEDFSVEGNTIRYGIKSIKSVSEKTLVKLKEFNSVQTNKFQLFEAANKSGINIRILSNLIKAGCLSSFGDNRGLLTLEAASWNALTDSQKTKIFKFGEKYNYDLLNILLDIKDGKLLSDGKEIISTKKRKTKSGEKSSWDTFYSKYLPHKLEWSSYAKYVDFYNYYYEQDILGFAYSKKLFEILESEYKGIIHLGDLEDAVEDSIVTSCGIVQEANVGKTQKGNKKLTLTIGDEYGQSRVQVFNFNRFDRATRTTEFLSNVDDLKDQYGRLPEKKDVIVFRGTKKTNTVFADKIRILNLDFKESSDK